MKKLHPIVRNILIVVGILIAIAILVGVAFVADWIMDLVKAIKWSYVITAIVSSTVTAIVCGIVEAIHQRKQVRIPDDPDVWQTRVGSYPCESPKKRQNKLLLVPHHYLSVAVGFIFNLYLVKNHIL